MANYYDILRGLVTPQMLDKAASTLGENRANTEKAVEFIIPSLLGRFLKESDSEKIVEIISMAGENNVIGKIEDIFQGHGVIEGVNYGERFENALLGSEQDRFKSEISKASGISEKSVDRLNNWVSALVAGFIGNKVKVEKSDYSAIVEEVKKSVRNRDIALPNALLSILGVGAFFKSAGEKIEQGAKKAGEKLHDEEEKIKERVEEVEDGTKCGAKCRCRKCSWIWWLLLAVVIILLILWWRSCDREEAVLPVIDVDEQVAEVEEAAEIVEPEADDGTATILLPNNVKIVTEADACEVKIYEFINSKKFANATNEELSKEWLDFNNIDFIHGSSSELTDGSLRHLQNIAYILSAYPELKIKIGGYADKTGTDEVNVGISQKRADYVKKLFVHVGVEAERISTVAFGERLATHPESETDEERAPDRHVGLILQK